MKKGFPLQWPDNIPRTSKSIRAPFKVSSIDAPRKGILKEIRLLNGKQPVITTNIPLRSDGQLYATGKPAGGEMAVAVYFTWQGTEYVIACDNYDRIEDNLRAAEKIIEAIRGIERWGNKGIVEQAFEGFKSKQLSQGSGITKTNLNTGWWIILQVDKSASKDVIIAAYRSLVKKYHPDNLVTGNKDKFIQVQTAFQEATI